MSESHSPQQLFDFRDSLSVRGWSAVDDRVMGGISRSRLRHDPAGFAVFEGVVSLERNGGFASVRADLAGPSMARAQRCQLEVRGQSKLYKLNLITAERFDAISYQAEFTPFADAWQLIGLPMAAFRASFRGRAVPDAPPLLSANIRQLGLMLSGGQAGEFSLDVRSIWLA